MYKSLGRRAGYVFLVLLFISANTSQGLSPQNRAEAASSGEQVVSFTTSDPRLNVAQENAQRYLTRFFNAVLDDTGMARNDAAVQVAIPTNDATYEVIWITPFAQNGDHFIGLLANKPSNLVGLKAGDAVKFSAEQVRDWYFIGRNGRIFGSYTTRAMLDDLDADQAEMISSMLSDSPVPSDW